MLRVRPSMLIVSLVIILLTMGLIATVAGAQQAITIQLGAQNNSGISGTAVLTPMGNQTKVTINVQGSPAGANHPAHIHVGSCPNPGAVVAPLPNVQNGMSEATVNMSIDQIRGAQHAVNLHKSPQEASVYIACGNVPLAAAAAPAGGMPRTGAGGMSGDLYTDVLITLGGLLLLVAAGVTIISRRRVA